MANINLNLFNYLQILIQLNKYKHLFTQCAQHNRTIPITPALLWQLN